MPLLSFDRSVPQALVDALSPGRPFHDLVAMASGPYSPDADPLDLRLRGNPGRTGSGHARIYLGTTQVGALYVNRHDQFRFKWQASERFAVDDAVADERWDSWQPLHELAADADAILALVRTHGARAPKSYRREGGLQTAIARSSSGFRVLDREVAFSFPSALERDRMLGDPELPSNSARAALYGEFPWVRESKRFGGEIDALGIDDQGRVLVIEAKDGEATGQVGWTPAQVAVYLGLVRSWIAQGEDTARAILERMASQYVAIGMLPEQPSIADPLVVIPVIALSALANGPIATKRMAIVRAALVDAGESLEGLEVWVFDADGAFAPLALDEPSS